MPEPGEQFVRPASVIVATGCLILWTVGTRIESVINVATARSHVRISSAPALFAFVTVISLVLIWLTYTGRRGVQALLTLISIGVVGNVAIGLTHGHPAVPTLIGYGTDVLVVAATFLVWLGESRDYVEARTAARAQERARRRASDGPQKMSADAWMRPAPVIIATVFFSLGMAHAVVQNLIDSFTSASDRTRIFSLVMVGVATVSGVFITWLVYTGRRGPRTLFTVAFTGLVAELIGELAMGRFVPATASGYLWSLLWITAGALLWLPESLTFVDASTAARMRAKEDARILLERRRRSKLRL